MIRLSEKMYNPDWVDYEVDIQSIYSPRELVLLVEYKDTVQPLVLKGLHYGGGTHAALTAGYLQYQTALPILREKLLTLRHPYLWDGSWDYTQEESILDDNQYQYHVAYIRAIESITEKPLKESILLTPLEIKRLRTLASQTKIEVPQTKGYCAKWLLLKFGY